ncbi:aminopeptidase O isoform X3 [Esox lucius]|uniref:aminopeptidase O isoform X3 n=1 Tax=Esox lucius TaxID=8010 RepID=UPI00147694D0|nr:aminopeptidase O isoform X3 [Esox lucius]
MGDDVNPDRDDLPLRANTSHILVRHYVLDLDIHFHTQVITGTLVLFLEPGPGAGEGAWAGEGPGAGEGDLYTAQPSKTADSWEDESNGDFTLVLDCCDLAVSKVEELDVASVLDLLGLLEEVRGEESVVEPQPGSQSAVLIQRLISLPATQWKKQHHLYSQCSRAPASESGRPLVFHTDRWSLQVRHRGTRTPQEFPRALRICYETKPEGGSVRWTKDQDNRSCVYTAGSPINNRALFPCQEPPVAMSTWQARVRAPRGCVVLLSGENQAEPTHLQETGLCSWDYYVTMPMPASTFTLAVGSWSLVPTAQQTALFGAPHSHTGSLDLPFAASPQFMFERSALKDEKHFESGCTVSGENNVSCCHVDYPCRFTEASAWSQRIIPHRVFAPPSLVPKAQFQILPLLPRCLAAAHATLGVHPFPRLDILIVPAGFSSLGMASPHIIFLSQSVLCGERDGVGGVQPGLSLCGSRLCHELSHSWFGLAIGARDWTEEWISEGFATYLEDVIWARAQQLSRTETDEQSKLKALLRWRRLSEELQNSEDQLQILRPNMESTGQVSESGSSFVKHALNPEKNFMQVHYLKGYFLLRFLASKVEDERFLSFFKLFVMKYHGQLILSQDFLQMLLETFPDKERQGLTLEAIHADWLDRPGIPKWLFEGSAAWTQTRLVEEVKAEPVSPFLSLPQSVSFTHRNGAYICCCDDLVVKWIGLNQSVGRGRKRKRARPKVNLDRVVTPEQLVLLLELLLEEAELSVTSLCTIQRTYNLQEQDAEVRHRWCELVVKHKHTEAYHDVEHFLQHDQAMGVYLYGELMVHEDARQQALARHCLSLLQDEMDQSARRVVEEMVL